MSTRVYLDQPLASGASITLVEDAARHLVQVLRMAAGDSFIAFNGQGGEYEAVLEAVSKRGATARIGRFFDTNRESPLRVTLAQSVSKGERMDYTLQKAVELGVSAIVPLVTEHGVVRLDGERWDKKLEHWRGVMNSACEQTGRTQVPTLAPVAKLYDWLPKASGLRLVLEPTFGVTLKSLTPAQDVTLLIGPEGGLSEAEVQSAIQQGFTAVKVGPRVLRTETAGPATLAALQALWGDWS